MEFKKSKLETIKNALQYAVLYAKTEEETAEFALMLSDVQHEINKEWFSIKSQVATGMPESTSLKGCPFHYCDNNPKCEHKCRYA